ncbi:MAG: sodium:solute symporter [Candidatus Neomarinimicrobiota bacterium]
MNLSYIDWLIILAVLGGMIYSVSFTKGLMKSVTDFLSAGRSAGRYLISVSAGAAGLGAISIVGFLEVGYITGFSMAWWGLSQGIFLVILTTSGWVIYRFRQTKSLTLAQFFEKRYSRNFRIFAGIIAFVCGIINFGIFPAVGAQFFMSYCGFPDYFIGIPTFPLVMIFLISIALYFVYTGGQIAVIIADFFQGVFLIMVLFIITIFLYNKVEWSQVSDSLKNTPVKLAKEEIQKLKKEETFILLSDKEKIEKIDNINDKYENSSLINPFKTSQVEDFNLTYFLIGLIGMFYGALSWQGQQAYNSSAKSAHEAKMASVLGDIRWKPQSLFIFLVPVLTYVFMNHPDFQSTADSVNLALNSLETETLKSQMRAPIVLSEVLPVGLLGAFAALMLAAFISTHDTYLHSWASIFVQDVIMPLRKKPFEKDEHIKALRYSIFGVAVFIFVFSLVFDQNQEIALYFAVTFAIFAGGVGAVIIGGLYWDRGTTEGAWAAMIIGATVAVTGTIVPSVSDTWLSGTENLIGFKKFILKLKEINGIKYYALSMGFSSFTYVIVSLLTFKEKINMDKLLNRGKYSIKEEIKVVDEKVKPIFKLFGIGKEFTVEDKIIYLVSYVWNIFFTLVFVIGTIYNLYNNVSDESWMVYWKYQVYINAVFSFIIIIWFTIGGFIDIKKMFRLLDSNERDHQDSGWVEN